MRARGTLTSIIWQLQRIWHICKQSIYHINIAAAAAAARSSNISISSAFFIKYHLGGAQRVKTRSKHVSRVAHRKARRDHQTTYLCNHIVRGDMRRENDKGCCGGAARRGAACGVRWLASSCIQARRAAHF